MGWLKGRACLGERTEEACSGVDNPKVGMQSGVQADRVQAVLRSSLLQSSGSKRDSLRSVRGAVPNRLAGGPRRRCKILTVLFVALCQWDSTDRLWKYNLFMKSASSGRPESAERIRRILRNTFAVAEMLNEEERDRTSRNDSHEIYEEL